ncbi:MAG: FdhF/YdeP family oxidoreductase [Nitrospirae bacterium]|nr:FdhF/YdeP family oxidoreductase [Nitrospirota bacterium]
MSNQDTCPSKDCGDHDQPHSRRRWVSLIPFGLHEQHPNHFKDILHALWDNRDNLPYASRILRDGCCDGCALGTTGLHDWTMKDLHLCWVRLQLLRLNTMPAMNWRRLETVAPLRAMKGRALRKLGRLAVPMVRRRGEAGFRRLSWEEAIGLIAERLRQVDPRRLGWYLTSRGLTNEAYYAHQKVARFLGTNHVDTSARICHAPSTSAMMETVGCAASTCSYSDWIGTDLLVFIGANTPNNQPVSLKYLYYAKKAGTKIFVVNPYVEPGLERYWIPSVAESALFGTRLADAFFHIQVGGDIAFSYGVLKHLVERDWVNREFIASRTSGWPALEAKVQALSWDIIERDAGLSRADLLRFAAALGQARHAIFVWSMGITQHRYGSDNVRALVNLQLARGNVGRPHAGLMPIRGHSGVQGGAEMGATPTSYLMGMPVDDDHAQRMAHPGAWGFEPPAWKGMGAAHLILAAERGEIDALWLSGGNMMETLPEPDRVRRAFAAVGLRVHQDIVVTSAMLEDPADLVVLLPSRTRYEQCGGGTETSTERRIIYSPEIPGPRPGDTRDEWEIPVLVARRLDPDRAAAVFPWQDTQDIRREIDRLCPTYKGIGSLKKKGDNVQYGGPHLLTDSFPTPDGKGRFSMVDLPEEHVPAHRFLLTTRRGKQFNSMVEEGHDPLIGTARDSILMSQEDAEQLGLQSGDAVILRNEVGKFQGRVKIDRVKPGCLQGYWPEMNVLVPAGRLDASGVPDYNATVEVIPVSPVEPLGAVAGETEALPFSRAQAS